MKDTSEKVFVEGKPISVYSSRGSDLEYVYSNSDSRNLKLECLAIASSHLKGNSEPAADKEILSLAEKFYDFVIS